MIYVSHDTVYCRLTVDCGRYSLCNGTFRSLLIKDTTTLAYSVAYTYQLKYPVCILAFV